MGQSATESSKVAICEVKTHNTAQGHMVCFICDGWYMEEALIAGLGKEVANLHDFIHHRCGVVDGALKFGLGHARIGVVAEVLLVFIQLSI